MKEGEKFNVGDHVKVIRDRPHYTITRPGSTGVVVKLNTTFVGKGYVQIKFDWVNIEGFNLRDDNDTHTIFIEDVALNHNYYKTQKLRKVV